MDSGLLAEPVIGPRVARTRWLEPGMTTGSQSSATRFAVGRRVPLWSFSALQKKRGSRAPTGAGAEAPHPMTRLAVGSISGSPEMTGRIADRRASRRSAAAFSLRHRAALSGICADQPAPGRRMSPPGGAPTPPVRRLTRPGTRAPHRRRPGFRRAPAAGTAWPVLRPRFPACSIKPASPVDAPRRARRR